MARVIAGMVMSLDGYVSDRDGGVGLLYPDFEAMRDSDAVQDAILHTGAVVMGRRSYDMGNGDFTGYEFQAPIFVVTHDPPGKPARGQNEHLTFTYVTDGVASAIEQAKTAAGNKDVTIVGGPDTIRQALASGLVDELHMDIRAVLLGDGLPMFERSDTSPIELDLVAITQSTGVTHLRWRVERNSVAQT